MVKQRWQGFERDWPFESREAREKTSEEASSDMGNEGCPNEVDAGGGERQRPTIGEAAFIPSEGTLLR